MDNKKFDDIARSVASMASRRSVVKGIVGGAFAGVVGLRGASAAKKRGSGETCRANSECAEGLLCVIGKDGRRRCGCETGFSCGSQCCQGYCESGSCKDNVVDAGCFNGCVESLCYGSNFNYTFNNQQQCQEYCAWEVCEIPV